MTLAEKAELARLMMIKARNKSRDSFEQFSKLQLELLPADHHKLMIRELEALERGETEVLFMFLPPGSGKSIYSSVMFPAWFLGRNPEKSVIAVSHTAELAERFGRRVRNIVGADDYNETFGISLAADSAAAGRWETTKGGEYYACGMGGSVTGRRADVACIDDIVASREIADSETMRNKTWEWFINDLMTRLKPGAKLLFVMCMTGDTPVLMSDGTEKSLREINVGDEVATYKNGKLSLSTVKNWKSNGLDTVFEIKTSSGTTVKANERHPFLVFDGGELKWIRTKDLRLSQEICRVSGENGKARLARGKDATSQLDAKDIAPHITGRNAGSQVLSTLPKIVNHGVKLGLNIATGFLLKTMSVCLLSRMGNAPSAISLQAIMSAPTGVESYASTITTKQAKSDSCSAMIAILLSVMQKLQRLHWLSQPTSDFTLDKIEYIRSAGVEEVFDVQIEETENFIANGLVSHNTRWHEDDLAGRALPYFGHRARVIKIPMEAGIDDPVGRKPGERLWPEWYTDDMVELAKRDPRVWTALYQQEPRPGEGGEFRREWLQYYDDTSKGAGMNKIILVDPANAKRASNDFTSMWVIGLGKDRNYYVLDMVRDRLNLNERTRKLFELHQKWRPYEVRYERYGMMADIEHMTQVMNQENYRFKITEVAGQVKKEDRIRRILPLFQNNLFYLPNTFWYTRTDHKVYDLVSEFINEEYLAFPVGRHDDMMDGLSRIAEPGSEFVLRWPDAGSLGGFDTRYIAPGVLDAVTGW